MQAATDVLPFTGIDVGSVAGIGAGLIAAGSALLEAGKPDTEDSSET